MFEYVLTDVEGGGDSTTITATNFASAIAKLQFAIYSLHKNGFKSLTLTTTDPESDGQFVMTGNGGALLFTFRFMKEQQSFLTKSLPPYELIDFLTLKQPENDTTDFVLQFQKDVAPLFCGVYTILGKAGMGKTTIVNSLEKTLSDDPLFYGLVKFGEAYNDSVTNIDTLALILVDFFKSDRTFCIVDSFKDLLYYKGDVIATGGVNIGILAQLVRLDILAKIANKVLIVTLNPQTNSVDALSEFKERLKGSVEGVFSLPSVGSVEFSQRHGKTRSFIDLGPIDLNKPITSSSILPNVTNDEVKNTTEVPFYPKTTSQNSRLVRSLKEGFSQPAKAVDVTDSQPMIFRSNI